MKYNVDPKNFQDYQDSDEDLDQIDSKKDASESTLNNPLGLNGSSQQSADNIITTANEA